MTTPKGFLDMQKQLAERNQKKISPELQKMHEIFGDPNANTNCGMAAQYEDGTCSRIVYDPSKMPLKERMEIRPTTPTEQPITEAEHQALRFVRFCKLIKK
jgi:hypothetical protein